MIVLGRMVSYIIPSGVSGERKDVSESMIVDCISEVLGVNFQREQQFPGNKMGGPISISEYCAGERRVIVSYEKIRTELGFSYIVRSVDVTPEREGRRVERFMNGLGFAIRED